MAVAKKKSKRITSASIREHAKKDHSPVWEGCESWNADKFHRHFVNAMAYYRLEFNGKDLKPAVLKWMATVEMSKSEIAAFKKTKDNRCSTTMGGVASCLLRGMVPIRADFNDGRDTVAWLRNEIARVVTEGKEDIDVEAEAAKEAATPTTGQPTIQERVRDAAYAMTDELEDAIEAFQADPENFDPKAFKILNLLKGRQVKAAHARIIKTLYARDLAELEELASGEADEQLREGYQHLSRKQVKNLIAFYQEIAAACDMLAQEAKVNRAPRAKKSVPKEKLIAKLKYKKTDEPLKLVSINPVDIIGAQELWVFNTKTRKLGKYVADSIQGPLSIKGTSIIGFDEHQSIQKTLRKPDEKLKEFKASSKVQLRKFLDGINATDTKMNGRLNEETILLRIA
ncbi:hypothetical protein UFOVP181_228 [uncultured Caudovirales phage]|uniref:Uncharacterized protein n=1 Tax=uncultured Caudovirales phage TaxID=2100421 RepID=A0A6J5L0S8_9CAUD|nr:hypothetical protein UFOVP57_411 [uncultured Caudovirales phage]CAB5208877.1 hypothetical protein UFOVP181_228 [uncultured Caudovirales phage]